jgi:folate-binding protein YgfZ
MAITLLLHGRHHPTQPPTYEPFGPWLVPWRFTSFETEHQALRASAGLVDYSTQALIQVTGADRTDFLQRLLTNDLTRLAPGGGCRAALLTASAKLVAELLVLVDPDAYWLLCDLARAGLVAAALEQYRFSEDVAVTNHERRDATLAVQGPSTDAALRVALGEVPAAEHPGDHARAPFRDTTIRLVRHTLTGDPGVLCLVEMERAEALWEELRRSGAAPVGWGALNTARIEAGIPWFGVDMDETTLLPEAGLEGSLVSDTKGCYLGQEIVARMQTYGSPSKRLVGLLVEAADACEAGDRLVRGSDDVGWVTSACRSPSLGRPIAMGYVKRGSDEPGTRVEIVRGTRRISATVTALPFIPART